MSKRKRKPIAVDISNWGGKVIVYDGIIFTSKEKAEKELERLKGENRNAENAGIIVSETIKILAKAEILFPQIAWYLECGIWIKKRQSHPMIGRELSFYFYC